MNNLTWSLNCSAIQTSYGIPYFQASTLTFVFGSLQVLTSLLIVLYLYCHHKLNTSTTGSNALERLSSSTRSSTHRQFVESTTHHRSNSLVLPVYFYCLWGIAVADLVQGCIDVLVPLNLNSGNKLWPQSVLYGIAYGLYHFVLEGIAFLLAQQGVGRYSLRRSLLLATAWGFVTFCLQIIAFQMQPGTLPHFITTLGWEATMLTFYLVLSVWPIRCCPNICCHRRPALRNIYAPFWATLRFMSCTAIIIQMNHFDIGICLYDIGVLLPFAILKPFIIYWTLRRDSRFWMGLGTQNHPLQRPLMGSNLGASSARELASQLDTSMTRGVQMLQPSLLELEDTRLDLLGIGGSARVMKAKYRGRPVAAKLLFLPELTPDHVRSLCNEASLLSGVQSDHVLKVFGLVVRPPSIFLVSEVATYGSLFDMLIQTATISAPTPTSTFVPSMPGLTTFSLQNKTMLFRLHLAIGCAESVEVLHQQNPAVVHGDIKSQNFLMSSELMVKIADLELASRCLQSSSSSSSNSMSNSMSNSNSNSNSMSSGGGGGGGEGEGEGGGENGVPGGDLFLRGVDKESKTTMSSMDQLRRLSQSMSPDDPEYRISETFNWLAPEVINGHSQTPSSDVYSLAMTLYEVFTDTVPYGHLQLSSKFDSDALKHEICTNGVRPGSCNVSQEMDLLLQKMWHQDQSVRPDSATVLKNLKMNACHYLFGELKFVDVGDDRNMLFAAIESSGLCGAVLDAVPPFRVQFVSEKWQSVCGWPAEEIVGKTIFDCLRGPLSNQTRTRNFKLALALRTFFYSGCVHYTKSGAPMLHVFSTTLLAGDKPLLLLRSAATLWQ